MDVKDVYPKQGSLWVRLHEKGGKHHEMPCQHNLKDWLREYIEAAGIQDEKISPLFRSIDRKTKQLSDRRLDRQRAWAMANGVNVAARLETLADPGGICISQQVLDQVEGKLEVGLSPVGPCTVKNIKKPLDAYRILLDSEAAETHATTPNLQPTRWQWTAVASIATFVAATVALVVWQQPMTLPGETASALQPGNQS
jgi:hypothetical protein